MTAPIQFQENIKNDFVKPGKTVEIIAAGMVTAVGGNIEQTLAAVRAGISAYKESDVSILIPTKDFIVTPISESFHSVICHLLVSHPALKVNQTKWESIDE